MFTVLSTRYANSPLLHCVELMCECGFKSEVDVSSFHEITSDYVTLKKSAKITCQKCGKSQPKSERVIYISQMIHTPQPLPTRQKGILYRFVEGMADMTPEQVQFVSNQVAAFNDDFSDSCD